MPAQESAVQSAVSRETYRLRDGRLVEIRNGLVCEAEYPRLSLVQSSDESAKFLLDNAILTTKARYEIETKWRYVWPTTGGPPIGQGVTKRHWEMQTQKEREAA